MAAGLLVLATHVPLGMEVLRRGILFIDLAIAQVAGLGVMIAIILKWDSPLAVQAAAAGILVLAGNPHGGERLQDPLAGQILWVGWRQLLPVALLYAAVAYAVGLALSARLDLPAGATIVCCLCGAAWTGLLARRRIAREGAMC